MSGKKGRVGRECIRRIERKVWRSSLIYLGLVTAALFLGYTLGHARIWHGEELLYPLLHLISEHVLLTGGIVFLAGEMGILAYYFARLGRYFQEMTDAMEQLYREENVEISLPEELVEAENQMNRIRSQIVTSRMEAREVQQRKDDLVMYLAHDLKTPLTSVLGYLMLLEEAPELPAQIRAKYLGVALKKARRLEELINEFFEITRFRLNAMELEMRSVNFNRLLEQTVFEFGLMFQEKNMTCVLEAPEQITVSCDLDKMQRVVDNLLRNCVLYGYEGSQIRLTLERTPQGVLFTCANRGPTIPPEKLERIFEQFYRLDDARSSSTGGAGLGLAIAREIVRLHGGEISAESRDETTLFRVRLP